MDLLPPIRAVGFCPNLNCEDYAKGTFLMGNQGGTQHCACGHEFIVETEHAYMKGDKDLIREVRLEYGYCFEIDKYKEICIVIDQHIPKAFGGVYYHFSPLIRTPKRATQVAEAMMGNLMMGCPMNSNGVVSCTEMVLNLDDGNLFYQNLNYLGQRWSKLSKKYTEVMEKHASECF